MNLRKIGQILDFICILHILCKFHRIILNKIRTAFSCCDILNDLNENFPHLKYILAYC